MFLSKEYASRVLALPECVQIADRFHLLQNLIDRRKEVFKDELSPEIFIRNGEVLNLIPEKMAAIKISNDKKPKSYHYDDTPPVDGNGNEVVFDRIHKCRSERKIPMHCSD